MKSCPILQKARAAAVDHTATGKNEGLILPYFANVVANRYLYDRRLDIPLNPPSKTEGTKVDFVDAISAWQDWGLSLMRISPWSFVSLIFKGGFKKWQRMTCNRCAKAARQRHLLKSPFEGEGGLRGMWTFGHKALFLKMSS